MKIAIVSPFPIYPTHGGNRARLDTFIEALTARGHGVDFILLGSRQLGEFDETAHEERFGARYHFLGRPGPAAVAYLCSRAGRAAGRRLRSALRLTTHPLDHVDEIFFGGFLAPLKRLFEVGRYDAVVVQYVTLSRALTVVGPATLRVIDTHDSFAFSLSPAQERRGLARADVVVAIQDAEALNFRRLLTGARTEVRVVSHIARPGPPVCGRDIMGATCIGSSFAANRASVLYFIEAVLPLILDQLPQFEFFVAGAVANEVPDHAAVRKLGRVGEIADAFADAPLLVNPIREGTGVKVKLLDAMALGVPAISTALGVEGIGSEFLGGVVVASDAVTFADAVVGVISNPGRREALSRRALAAAAAWNLTQLSALEQLFSEGPSIAAANAA